MIESEVLSDSTRSSAKRAPLGTPDLLDVRAALRRARDSAALELRETRCKIPAWDSGVDTARATK